MSLDERDAVDFMIGSIGAYLYIWGAKEPLA